MLVVVTKQQMKKNVVENFKRTRCLGNISMKERIRKGPDEAESFSAGRVYYYI